MSKGKAQAVGLTRRHIMAVLAAAAGNLPGLALPSPASAREHHERHHYHHQDYHHQDYHHQDYHHQYVDPAQTMSHQCFLKGTSILTPDGEARVENLAIGDFIVTDRGTQLPVKWIGHRCFKKEDATAWQQAILPVRVLRSAIHKQLPRADLYLSPSHALFIDDVLIPAIHLVNGTSIVQAIPEGLSQIEYFHIELETHEVIFAEGVAVETLLLLDDHDSFDNFFDFERLYGPDNRRPMRPYAPRVCYNGGRSELKALLRRAASSVIDVRDPIQVAYDRIRSRAVELAG